MIIVTQRVRTRKNAKPASLRAMVLNCELMRRIAFEVLSRKVKIIMGAYNMISFFAAGAWKKVDDAIPAPARQINPARNPAINSAI